MNRQRLPLFDLGNVIVKVDFAPFLAWLTERCGLPDPAHSRALLSSSLFYDLEFGHISREEFGRRLGARYGAELPQRELEERFCAIFPGAVEGMVELLGELAAEGPVYCLSNTNEIHLEHIRERHPKMLRAFTRIFASHELRARKPHPGIYQAVAAELGVAPASLVFFDDVPENVEGAREAGLEAHLFTEAGRVRKLLKGIRDSGDNERHGG